jgi:hypothetical protein
MNYYGEAICDLGRVVIRALAGTAGVAVPSVTVSAVESVDEGRGDLG